MLVNKIKDILLINPNIILYHVFSSYIYEYW